MHGTLVWAWVLFSSPSAWPVLPPWISADSSVIRPTAFLHLRSGDAWHATAPDFGHVRSAQADVGELLTAGYERSVTFKALVDEIESLPGIVYIEKTIALSRGLNGALLLAAAGSRELPILRVLIRANLSGDYRIANLAHELEHVVEVLRAGATTSGEMSRLFASLDEPDRRPGPRFETAAAQEITEQVLKELGRRVRRPASPPAHAKTAKPMTAPW